MIELAQECAESGWDGAEGTPIDLIVVSTVEHFIRGLPDDIPLPEFAPEPDGSISLDWIASRTRLFSLSFGHSNRLPYAWLDGADKGYGVARFDGQNIPPRILDAIKHIVGKGYAGLRVA